MMKNLTQNSLYIYPLYKLALGFAMHNYIQASSIKIITITSHETSFFRFSPLPPPFFSAATENKCEQGPCMHVPPQNQ
jgi:hypothetical protein